MIQIIFISIHLLSNIHEDNPADNALTDEVFDESIEDFQIDKSPAKNRKLNH